MGFDPNQEFNGSQGIDPLGDELYDHTQVNNANQNRQTNFIRDDFDINEYADQFQNDQEDIDHEIHE